MRRQHADGRDWTWLADALLPVIAAHVEQQANSFAADMLDAEADVHWADRVRWSEVRTSLRNRAAALRGQA
jgi:hypothetical protein